jgi:hypothetical protein
MLADRLTVNVRTPTGREARWASDEPRVDDVPAGVTFSTEIPGGFKDCTIRLPRGFLSYPDEALFSDVLLTGAGGQVAWEGRVVSLPRAEGGDGHWVTVGCVGHAAKLRDDATLREIYIDRDLTRWGSPSAYRRGALISGATKFILGGDTTLTTDPVTGNPALRQQLTRIFGDATTRTLMEAAYDPQGVPIGALYYNVVTGQLGGASMAGTSWSATARLASDDTHSAEQLSSDVDGGGSGTLNSTGDRRWASVDFYYDATGTFDGEWHAEWRHLIVFGTHGLTLRGTAPACGYYATDIMAHVARRAGLNVWDSDIEATTFIVPQAAYLDPVTGEDIVLDVNKYELARWAVWQGQRFHVWRNPTSRTVWETRIADGATRDLEGDSAESVWNAVAVQFEDPHGRRRIIGPTGYSPADATSALLLDTDPSNAATAAGLPRVAKLALSFPTDASGAEQIGYAWLREQLLPARRGAIQLPAYVRHPQAGMVPSWNVRAGDLLRVTDRPGEPDREITSTSYDTTSRRCQATVGGLPNRVEAILERTGVRRVG